MVVKHCVSRLPRHQATSNQLLLLCFFLCFFSFLIPTRASSSFTSSLYSEHILIYNVESDFVVYKKEEHQRTSPASLTKLMSAIIVREQLSPLQLQDQVVVTTAMLDGLIAQGATINGLRSGDVVSVLDLLKGMLIASGADSSNALAAYVESIQDKSFVDLMNDKVEQLGLLDTRFANAHGLDEVGQYTTAYDMSIIGKEVIKDELLKEILTEYTDSIKITGTLERNIALNHGFLAMNPQSNIYTPSVVFGKPGYTGEAGRCVLTYLNQGGVSYLVVLLKAPIPFVQNHFASNIDIASISKYLYQQHKLVSIKTKGDWGIARPLSYSINVKSAYFDLERDPVLLIPSDKSVEDITVEYLLPTEVMAPIVKGSKAGVVQFRIDDVVINEIALLATATYPYMYDAYGFGFIRVLGKYWVYIVCAILFYSVFLHSRHAGKRIQIARRRAFKNYYYGEEKEKNEKAT